MKRITLKAPAKINLTLDILGKRADGYHELRTIMQSVSIYDTLTIEKTGGSGIILECDRDDVPRDGSNLVVKAAKAFLTEYGIDQGLRFKLSKHIPSMAGMAGGSTDCAAALIGLDMLFDAHTPLKRLIEIGASLGADVPFCLAGGTHICEGIGEKLTSVRPMPKCGIVIVKPQASISTPQAFSQYDSMPSPERSDFRGIVMAFDEEDLGGICQRLFNALEYASGCREIAIAKKRLADCGAKAALMTGSGSAVYGIFNDHFAAIACAEALKNVYSFCEVCSPLDGGCEVTEHD